MPKSISKGFFTFAFLAAMPLLTVGYSLDAHSLPFKEAIDKAGEDLAGLLAKRLKPGTRISIVDFRDGVAKVHCQPLSNVLANTTRARLTAIRNKFNLSFDVLADSGSTEADVVLVGDWLISSEGQVRLTLKMGKLDGNDPIDLGIRFPIFETSSLPDAAKKCLMTYDMVSTKVKLAADTAVWSGPSISSNMKADLSKGKSVLVVARAKGTNWWIVRLPGVSGDFLGNERMQRGFVFVDGGIDFLASSRPKLKPKSFEPEKEILFWKSIVGSNDPESFRAYLARFPKGTFAALARMKIVSLVTRPAAKQISTARSEGSQGGEALKFAEAGDAQAQFNLGYDYSEGDGVEIDHVLAVHWYQKAAKQGHAYAQFNLALKYENGEGVLQDSQKAIFWFLKAAEQGDADAQVNLGIAYANGESGNLDYSEALKWLLKAAEQRNAAAQYFLGLMYDGGAGVEEDKTEAVSWYRKAAEQGVADAQINLGLIYEYGRGVSKDYLKAFNWYQKAASQLAPVGQFNLANMYMNGWGVAEDKAEAVKWYRKAAEQGDADAQDNLGLAYDLGQGIAEDNTVAVIWYRKAAIQELAVAQWHLGTMYDNGEGVSEDKAEAVKWYRKAAEQGDADAQDNLGLAYYNGEGVAEDKVEAVKWYRKAAEQGNAAAQNGLGDMYENGFGLTKDYSLARSWYRKSADQGEKIGQFSLGILHQKGLGVPVDIRKAYFWLVLASGVDELGDEYQSQLEKILAETKSKIKSSEIKAIESRAAAWQPK